MNNVQTVKWCCNIMKEVSTVLLQIITIGVSFNDHFFIWSFIWFPPRYVTTLSPFLGWHFLLSTFVFSPSPQTLPWKAFWHQNHGPSTGNPLLNRDGLFFSCPTLKRVRKKEKYTRKSYFTKIGHNSLNNEFWAV